MTRTAPSSGQRAPRNGRTAVIPYSPRPLQAMFHSRRTRFCVLLCHRRFGKTVAAVNDLIREAVRAGRPDWRAAYAAPFLGQAKAIAWDYLRYFAGAIPGARFHEGELRCDLPGGARIRLFGVDNPNALRGLYLDDLVLDEPADMPREVWTQILRPALADRHGRALFIGTPAGTENLLYDLWTHAGRGDDPEWSRFRFRASESGALDATELEAARSAMSAEEYAQEFECSFTAAVRGAYYAALLETAEREGRIGAVPHDPALPVHTAWDLGMDDATAVWFFQVSPGGVWRVVDYYEASGEGLPHYVRVLQEKAAPAGRGQGRGFVYGRHIAPHDIRVRELGTGVSRQECAARLGLRFDMAPSLPLADGIDALRRQLPRTWFDQTHCAQGLRSLRNYRREWRPRQESFSSRPLHDWTSHAADALLYAVLGFRPAEAARGPRTARTQYDLFGGL
ncbi:MAG: terminase family protein [Desulfovibrionaceae bacterium]|nr:terminase family protein [Desulfovibrionaceae bacterium]